MPPSMSATLGFVSRAKVLLGLDPVPGVSLGLGCVYVDFNCFLSGLQHYFGCQKILDPPPDGRCHL